MNRMSIKVALNKLNSGIIHHLVQTKYYKLGVFIDLRCYDKKTVAFALSEVKKNC